LDIRYRFLVAVWRSLRRSQYNGSAAQWQRVFPACAHRVIPQNVRSRHRKGLNSSLGLPEPLQSDICR